MKTKSLIRLGKTMGLKYEEKTQFTDALEKGRVVFDGCNGQRFLFESTWKNDKIYAEMGKALIRYGRRLQNYDIHQLTSIHQP